MSTNNLKYAFTCSTELALVGGGTGDDILTGDTVEGEIDAAMDPEKKMKGRVGGYQKFPRKKGFRE